MAGIERCKVRDLQTAIELAQKFKTEGRYDWFRGQVRDWPLYSSAYRRWLDDDPEALAKVGWRQQQFLNWAANTQGLEALAADEDSLYAVMQHYGIPTDLIDFTTDPSIAGFFAADTANPPEPGSLSCIYCLNTDDLTGYWRVNHQFSQGGDLRLVRLNVPNLWRLEAQQGVFLYSNHNWALHYPPDRILFPYTGYPNSPKREAIYPERKSFLEVLLDQYFDREQKLRGIQVLNELASSIVTKGGRDPRTRMEDRADFCRPQALRGDSVEIHPSWDRARLAEWLSIPTEKLVEAVGPSMLISLTPDSTHRHISATVQQQVLDRMRAEPGLRRISVYFHFQGVPGRVTGDVKRLDSMLARIWDGMRRLPFTDEDIAEAAGHATALFTQRFHPGNSEAIASDYFGDAQEVEFSATDGSSSRGYAAKRDLLAAVRSDIRAILTDDYQKEATNIASLLWAIYSPMRLFEFEAFVRVFARQIIPSQVLMRDRVLFSPGRLKSFGLV